MALWITLLAVVVGVVVAAAAASSASGLCSAPFTAPNLPPPPPDTVCHQLVRTLAERTGLAAAAVTAIVVLTMIGLSRMAADQHSPPARSRSRP